MVEYFLKKISFKNNNTLPLEICNYISDFLPYKQIVYSIKNKKYINNGFWFKRITRHKIVDITRDEISYFDWYVIFHKKDYSMLIKYENCFIEKLLKTKSKEYIEKLHKDNLDNCHKRHFMNYKRF